MRGRMYDGLNLHLLDVGGIRYRVGTHPALTWTFAKHVYYGNTYVGDKWTARRDSFTFTKTNSNCTNVRGSFAKYYNHGKNGVPFTFNEFSEAVQTFCAVFGLHPGALKVNTFEFGPNVVPPIPTPEVLRCIIGRGTMGPSPMRKERSQAEGVSIEQDQFMDKAYDKAVDEGYEGELFRLELKILKLAALNWQGGPGRTMLEADVKTLTSVTTLADLLDWNVASAMCAHFLARFDELMILEPDLPRHALKSHERGLLERLGVPGYWQRLDSNRRCRERRTYLRLQSEYAPNGLKATLRASMVQQLTHFLGVNHRNEFTASDQW